MTRLLPLALAAPLLLAGCAESVGHRARPLVEQALADAEWGICQAAPIGIVRQRYGRTFEGAEAYRSFCGVIGSDLELLAPRSSIPGVVPR